MSMVRVKPITNDVIAFNDFVYIQNRFFKMFGQDFMEDPPPKWLKWLRRTYSTAATLSHFYCLFFIAKQVYLIFLLEVKDLGIFLRLISGFSYTLFAVLKFLAFFWNIQNIKMIHLELKRIYPQSLKDQRLYRVNQYFWPKWIRMMVFFYFGAVAFIGMTPLIQSIIVYAIELIQNGSDANFTYIKLYEIPYNFDHRNPLAYAVTYCIELLHVHFALTFHVSADLWLMSFIMQVSMHFEHLIRTMEQYEPDEENESKDKRFIAEFVRKHQVLLDLGDDINGAFSVLLFICLLSIACTLCFAGVYTLTQGIGTELLAYIAFLPIAIGQYYLICHYGQQLASISENVGNAAYNHPWYNGSQSYKKSILIIIIRSQRPVWLTALGLKSIGLEAFQMVLGESYRFLALLKQTVLD